MPAIPDETPPSPTGHEGYCHAWSPHRVVGPQRLPGAGDDAGDRRRRHLCADEHATGRTTRFVGRPGDRVHRVPGPGAPGGRGPRSEEHTSELQSLMRISYAVFCLKKKKKITIKVQHK